MSERRLADTNLIVSFLTNDHDQQAALADRLFEDCENGKLVLIVLMPVVAECVHILARFYKHDRVRIASTLKTLLTGSGIMTDELPLCLDALDRYAKRRVDFVDCLIAATAAARAIAVASFDEDFRHFADVAVDINPVSST